jgi:hypothetical protein
MFSASHAKFCRRADIWQRIIAGYIIFTALLEIGNLLNCTPRALSIQVRSRGLPRTVVAALTYANVSSPSASLLVHHYYRIIT